MSDSTSGPLLKLTAEQAGLRCTKPVAQTFPFRPDPRLASGGPGRGARVRGTSRAGDTAMAGGAATEERRLRPMRRSS
jgi:hypothetical protein